MKSAHSCRICRRWIEGEWSNASGEQRKVLEQEMTQGHCNACSSSPVWPVPHILDCAAVGDILGPYRYGSDKSPLQARTVSTYLLQSTMAGGRYVDHPFPVPDGHVGRHPYWLPGRVPEIQEWARMRLGQGKRS